MDGKSQKGVEENPGGKLEVSLRVDGKIYWTKQQKR